MIYWRSMPEGLKKKEETIFAQRLLADVLKQEYEISALPDIRKTKYGKPYFQEFSDIFFNYSHSKDAAVCIVGKEEVGIDLERIRTFHEKTAMRFCSKREWNWLIKQNDPDKAWIQIWTIKEAYVKYTGTGIRTDLRCLDFLASLESGEEAVITEPEPGKMVCLQSFFRENAWVTVCRKNKENEAICCI